MTIPEACQLIMQASAMGRGSEVFVLDMGEPIKISYLAEQMIRLSGKRLEDIQIEYVGLRPGEKLHEELFLDEEELMTTAHSKLRLAQARRGDDLDLDKKLDEVIQSCLQWDDDRILASLRELVPEFGPIPASDDDGYGERTEEFLGAPRLSTVRAR
jgi:FlaA1/EpsC-like NDP-sugar epimerase